ncbi:MAG: aminotransferase class IV, partial [Planctomycetota bacterium]
MNSADFVYLNGRIFQRGEAAVSPFDRGFLYGDGFFETTRVVGGRPLLIRRHLERLACSCRETHFGAPPDPGELASGVERLIEANGVETGYLRI